MKKIVLCLILAFGLFTGCSSEDETLKETKVSETVIETINETEDKWKDYQESLELTMWTFHGQVMTGDDIPVVLANENAAVMQFSVDAFNYDPSYFVYIYINDNLVEKAQYSNISTSLNITEEFLKEGEYTVRFVQYEGNEESGNVISEKVARYRVEWQ